MDPRYMAKQYVGQLDGERASFHVYTTGVAGWLLFRVLRPLGGGTFVETTIEVAHHARELKTGWRKKLH